MSKSHLINANIHRAKEGARVLEDIARFLLRDDGLFLKMRDIRHRIQMAAPIYNSKEDLGGIILCEDNVRDDLISLVQANAIRIQEALRVLEEMSSTAIEKSSFKALRYQAYDLHSQFYYAAKKHLKLNLLQGLYLIIDTDIIPYPIKKIIHIINQSPIHMVQYRNKSSSKKDIFASANEIRKLLDPNKLLIINDHIDIALDIGDGVHLGQEDYPLDRVRNIIPDDFILGISCHDVNEAMAAVKYNASYIAMGCLFNTKSKIDTIPITIDELQKVCHEASKPICAIGGINSNNIHQILTVGIKMVALISSVWKTENPLEEIISLHKKILMRV